MCCPLCLASIAFVVTSAGATAGVVRKVRKEKR
jgi:hypothetical protein